ncbi:MAG: hypothetical protein ACREPN_07385 [Rudaea sp.]
MNEAGLSFRELAARLPAAPSQLPSPDLWSRIAGAHRARQRRRRLTAVSAVLVLIAAVAMTLPAWRHAIAPTIDWRARAQALELQLDALPMPVNSSPMARLAESELARLDRNLQAAYDRGAPAADVAALWQRRSQLLNALLSVRRPSNLPATI